MVKNTTPTTGFFIIDKPAGYTSHDIVAKLRRITHIRRIGHTGTLDPFATGILLVPINRSTRLIQYTHEFPKTYTATLFLGSTSATHDPEGTITPVSSHIPNQKDIDGVLASFEGEQMQIPPMHAAIKIDGKKLYEYARAGQEVERKARPITIHALQCLRYTYPTLDIAVTVSSGTYIRVLAKDIGDKLGTGAYLTKLHRSAIGNFTDTKSMSIEALTEDDWSTHLHHEKELVSHLPTIRLSSDNVAKLQQGRGVPKTDSNVSFPTNDAIALFDAELDTFHGIVRYDQSTNTLLPRTIL